MLKGLIEGLVAVVVGFALLPVVQTSISSANLTGTLATLANIVPIMYVIVILLGVIAYVYVRNK